MWGSRQYHEYYYGVPAQYATAVRPAYQAGGGYSGTVFLAGLTRRIDKVWVGAYVRYDYLGGVGVRGQPAVQAERLSRRRARDRLRVRRVVDQGVLRLLIGARAFLDLGARGRVVGREHAIAGPAGSMPRGTSFVASMPLIFTMSATGRKWLGRASPW